MRLNKGIIYNIQRMSTQDGPGLRTTVFFKGCPLHCLWCSNPESQAKAPQLMYFEDLCCGCGRCTTVCPNDAIYERDHKCIRDFTRCVGCGACTEVCPTTAACMSGKLYAVEDVMKEIRKDAAFYLNSGGGVTFGGGECTMQGAFLMELIDACLDEGYHICLDTCAQTEKNFFKKLLSKVDLFLFDVKHMNSAKHNELTGIGNEIIQHNLNVALSLYPEKIRIRIPLMPGLNDTNENIIALSNILVKYNINQVDILPCHFFGRNKYEALGRSHPPVREYSPSELQLVMKKFIIHGLHPVLV